MANNNQKDIEKIKRLFERLAIIHRVYNKATTTESQKASLFEKSQFIVDTLEELGVDKQLSENLLMFGLEFIEAEYPEIVIQVKKNIQLVDLAETIFGVKAKKLSEEDEQVLQMAHEQNALVWVRQRDEGGKLGIKVLAHKRKPALIGGEQLAIEMGKPHLE